MQKVSGFAGRTDYPVDNSDNFGIVILKVKDLEEAETLKNNNPCCERRNNDCSFTPF